MEENAMNLPREYFSSSADELTRFAQIMFNRAFMEIFHNEDLNGDYELSDEELKNLILSMVYLMFCADGEMNEKEHKFALALMPEFDETDWTGCEKLDKELLETIDSFLVIAALRNSVRDLIRIITIAAVIDTSSINEKEVYVLGKFLDRLQY